MSDVLIVLIIFVLFPSVVLGFILLSRYLTYRETLTMIQHGINPSPPPLPMMTRGAPVPPRVMMVAPPTGGGGRGILIWGLVLSGIGLALTLALWPIGFIANSASGNSVNFPLGLGPWMLAGFVPLFVGLALILGYVIMRPERNANLQPAWTPTPGFPTGAEGTGPAYPARWTPGPPVVQESLVPAASPVVEEKTADIAPPSATNP